MTNHGVVMRYRYGMTGMMHHVHTTRRCTLVRTTRNVVRTFTETPAAGKARKRSRRKYALRPSIKDRIRSLSDPPSKPIIAHAARAAGFVQARLEEAQKFLYSIWGHDRPMRKGPSMDWWWWTWNIAFGLSPSIVIIILMETWGKPYVDEKLKIIEERKIKREELLIEEAMKQVPPKLPPLIIEEGKTPPAEVLIERINQLEERLDLFSRKRVEDWRDSQLSGVKKRIKQREQIDAIQKKIDGDKKSEEGAPTNNETSEYGGVWKKVATALGFKDEESFFEYAVQSSPFDRSPSVLKQKGTSVSQDIHSSKSSSSTPSNQEDVVKRAQAAAEEAQKHAIAAEAQAAQAREQANKNLSWTRYLPGGSSANESAVLASRVAEREAALARELANKAQEQAEQVMSQQRPQRDGSLQTDAAIARQRNDEAVQQREHDKEESKQEVGGHWSHSLTRFLRGGKEADDSNVTPAPHEPT